MTGLATAAFLAFGCLLVLFGAHAGEIIRVFELDYAQFGALGSMLSLGLGAGILAAGPFVDRGRRRWLFVTACAVVALATIGLDNGISYERLLLHAIVIGLGAGFYETLLNASIIEEAGLGAPRRMLFVHSAATLGATLAPVALVALRSRFGIDWADGFALAGILHIALGIAGLFVIKSATGEASARPTPLAPKSPSDVQSDPAESTPAAGPDRLGGADKITLGLICLVTFSYVGIETALTFFIAPHMEDSLGLDVARAGRAVSAFWGGLLVGRLAIASPWVRPGPGLVAGLATLAGVVIGLFGLGGLGYPEVVMASVGFLLGGVFPIMIALSGTTIARTGVAVGLAGGLGSVGGLFVPWITGQVADRAGLSTAFVSIAVWVALLVGASVWVQRRLDGRANSGGPRTGLS